MSKVAVFDIITPDLITGPSAATSEAVSIASECLDNFGNLWLHYEIHLSHARSTYDAAVICALLINHLSPGPSA